DVLDLLRRGGVGRQHFVELIEGHEAALLGLLDHLLDGSIRQVEQGRRGVGDILLRSVGRLLVFFLFLYLQRLCLRGHSLLPKRALRRGAPDAPVTDQHRRWTKCPPLTYANDSRENRNPLLLVCHALTRKRAALVRPPRITPEFLNHPLKARR